MDRKQKRIFGDILDKFKLVEEKITFIQYRNLKEFKYFDIERVNPNHRIYLYGVLKNNDKKKDLSKQFIKVGEIIIGFSTIMINSQILLQYMDFALLSLSMFMINCFFFYIFGDINILKRWLNYDYRYRRIYGRWENHLHGKMFA